LKKSENEKRQMKKMYGNQIERVQNHFQSMHVEYTMVKEMNDTLSDRLSKTKTRMEQEALLEEYHAELDTIQEEMDNLRNENDDLILKVDKINKEYAILAMEYEKLFEKNAHLFPQT